MCRCKRAEIERGRNTNLTHTDGSLCPICVHHMAVCDFSERPRARVRSWQCRSPGKFGTKHLLIWHGKKGGRPIARDYTDLRAHSNTHPLAHVCTLRNAGAHPLSAPRGLIFCGMGVGGTDCWLPCVDSQDLVLLCVALESVFGIVPYWISRAVSGQPSSPECRRKQM